MALQGEAIEVRVIWKDRILSSFGFSTRGAISIGGGPDADVRVPGLPADARYPLLNFGAQTQVMVAAGMSGEVISDLGRTLLEPGPFFMRQKETVNLALPGGMISLNIRHMPRPPRPKMASLLDANSEEAKGVLLALATLLMLWLSLGRGGPMDVQPDTSPLETRIGKFIFKKPMEVPAVKVQAAAPEIQQQMSQPQAAAKKHGHPKDAAPSGGFLNTMANMSASGAYAKAFLPGNDLTRAVGEGSHTPGAAEQGPALKETGAGRDGQTVSIDGVKTHGRGGNGDTGYRTGGLGSKSMSQIQIQGKDMGVMGGMDREAIRRVIVEHMAEIRNCYDRELQHSPSLYGKLVLTWDIDEGGRVTHAQVKSNSMENSAVGKCLTAHLSGWKFPDPPAGQIGRISYPFIFSSN